MRRTSSSRRTPGRNIDDGGHGFSSQNNTNALFNNAPTVAHQESIIRSAASPPRPLPGHTEVDDSGAAPDPPSADPDRVTASRSHSLTAADGNDTDKSSQSPLAEKMTPRVFASELIRRRSSTATITATTTASASRRRPGRRSPLKRAYNVFVTFGKFVGPGSMVSVAYIDPGNYATGISAGASYQFRLLFIVLLSNLFAIFLQSLSNKLGTVTGLNLAEANRAYLPRWLNYFLYGLAEIAIIATDIAEVIGTAIALNLLIPQLPLVAGCAISIIDVMLLLIFYRPKGSMRALRCFEVFVMFLVLAVVVCFCVELSRIDKTKTIAGQVLKGYLPNNAVVQGEGLYQACGILGATVMPHSLYLGSGLPQSRLMDYDKRHGLLPDDPPSGANSMDEGKTGEKTFYAPSMKAIKYSLNYSYAEIAISLFTFALFVNSAILIISGASLYQNPDALEADIFGIHDLLRSTLGQAAGTVFALALLFSGVSAGIVCTISGQMVCEGAIQWNMRPWLRRLITRSISITPSIIIAGAAGRDKLSAALNGSQVALSVVLPFISAPLIWFTCFDRYMTVQTGAARYYTEGAANSGRLADGDDEARAETGTGAATTATTTLVKMGNDWWVAVLAVIIWLVISVMNVANLVLLGLGKSV